MTSPLGFKTRVGSALFELCRGIRDIRSLRFTSDVTLLPVYSASIAASRLPHMRVSAEVGCWDLNHRPPAQQSDALSTRPRRPMGGTFVLFDGHCETQNRLHNICYGGGDGVAWCERVFMLFASDR